MKRNTSLLLTIIRDAKLPGVLELGDELDGVGYSFTWGPTGTAGLVRLNVDELEAQREAFDWIAQHPDIKIVDQLYKEGSDGVTEVVVVHLVNSRAAHARRNADELKRRIGKRRQEAHSDLAGNMSAAMVTDFHLGKVAQWEAERECWERIASHPSEFRSEVSSAVVDLIIGLGNSADALENALRERKLEGLRSFVRRARVYMDPEDAVDALMSF